MSHQWEEFRQKGKMDRIVEELEGLMHVIVQFNSDRLR
jgi:hypothetical protein